MPRSIASTGGISRGTFFVPLASRHCVTVATYRYFRGNCGRAVLLDVSLFVHVRHCARS